MSFNLAPGDSQRIIETEAANPIQDSYSSFSNLITAYSQFLRRIFYIGAEYG
jgi:hypothetical protein